MLDEPTLGLCQIPAVAPNRRNHCLQCHSSLVNRASAAAGFEMRLDTAHRIETGLAFCR